MTADTLRAAEEVAADYRIVIPRKTAQKPARKPPKPSIESVEAAQRRLLAKVAARTPKRVGEGWGK